MVYNYESLPVVPTRISFIIFFFCRQYPDFYYKVKFNIANSKAYMDVVMIDTVMLCGNSDHDYKHKQPTLAGAHRRVIRAAESQLEWIEDQLRHSKYVN